ncbi:hypothetical protein GWI33_004922 [Rhynchophorus ferrugineus]|uniref:RING-type domain-containing protein n=1 Tax=Rhynchophorus ferrugineus TaxID=354439 RepID=A0A834MMV4_RHYFE|nr:hypothetical protein GWI33_004922 [Rhynchophorus ferrugineus]
MIPVTGNIPLALCSVVLRRFIDNYTGNLPVPIPARSLTSTPTLALFSGVLFCLYQQLRRGTLVNIGLGKRVSSIIKNSRHTIQRRIKNKSWFLRNIDACRRKCTEAMHQLANNPRDSIRNIRDETGTFNEPSCSLAYTPKKDNEIRQCIKPRNNHIEIESLYSNNSYDVSEEHYQPNTDNNKKNHPYSERNNWDAIINRPVTRNFVKNCLDNNQKSWRKRLSSKKRKKETILKDEVSNYNPKTVKSDQYWVPKQTPRVSKGNLDKLGKSVKPQKITRKTRSGKVLPTEKCQFCKEICFHKNPKLLEHDEKSPKYVERVYCGHLFHQGCLLAYMKQPPFGNKTCSKCGNKIHHFKWNLTDKMAEAQWAHEQARERELQEVTDFFK